MIKRRSLLTSIAAFALIAVLGVLFLSAKFRTTAYQVTGDEDWLPQGQQSIDWYIAASGKFGTEYIIRLHRRRGGPNKWIADGPVEIRDDQDLVVLVGHFSNGKRHGKWTTWSADRSTKAIATWSDGVTGDEVRYDQDGNRIAVVTYLKNKPQLATHYTADGMVSSIVDYKEGTIKTYSDGQLTDTQSFKTR